MIFEISIIAEFRAIIFTRFHIFLLLSRHTYTAAG